jgi:hypothetical protein
MWEPRRLTTAWASTACSRDSFIFLYEPHPQLRGRFYQLYIRNTQMIYDIIIPYPVAQKFRLPLDPLLRFTDVCCFIRRN